MFEGRRARESAKTSTTKICRPHRVAHPRTDTTPSWHAHPGSHPDVPDRRPEQEPRHPLSLLFSPCAGPVISQTHCNLQSQILPGPRPPIWTAPLHLGLVLLAASTNLQPVSEHQNLLPRWELATPGLLRLQRYPASRKSQGGHFWLGTELGPSKKKQDRRNEQGKKPKIKKEPSPVTRYLPILRAKRSTCQEYGIRKRGLAVAHQHPAMASLLPLIQDLLPMILPTQIHITRGRDLAPERAPATGSSPEPRLDLPDVASGPSDKTAVSSTPDGGAGEDKNRALGAISDVAAALTGATAAAGPHGELLRTAAGKGVVRRDAIVNKTDRMCASAHSLVHANRYGEHPICCPVLFAGPRSSSSVHHNSEHDSIIYAASGRGILATSPAEDDGPPRRNELEPGDFVFVPAWTEHQLINDTDEQVTWVVIQGGPSPIVVDLEEWGGDEVKPERNR
ncbi:hypothetical protein RB600_005783 [Gaeumannomyces tritici]